MRSKKKVLIIVAIVLIIVIALAGTVAGMIKTGKVAITNKQKVAKGLADITNSIKISQLEEDYKEYKKLRTMPFEAENIITANINQIELDNTTGVEEILNEIKNVVENTKITNTIKADFKNNIINENLKIKSANIAEEISADVEYNDDRISIRSEDLNDKYITFTKNEAYFDNEHGDLIGIIELFESICKTGKTDLWLTEVEKNHFSEQYKEIFSSYITDDMIKEEKSTILIDGQAKDCDNINFTLNRNQITELVEKYLNKLEEDAEGRKIIVDKIKLIVDSFKEEDLLELINDLREEVLALEENANIKVSIYCTMLTTYGIDIELDDGYTKNKISIVLGNKEDEIYAIIDDKTILEIRKSESEATITFKLDGISIIINIMEVDNKEVLALELKNSDDNVELNVISTNQQISKNDSMETSKGTIEIELNVEANNIKVTLNIDSTLRYVDSIKTTTFDDSNSINLIKASKEELQQYLNEFNNNTNRLMQDTEQNSTLLQTINSIINGNLGQFKLGENANIPTDPATFNNMFKNYTGNQTGSAIITLLQTLSKNNKTNTSHKVSVSIIEDNATILNPTVDTEEIINASLFNIKSDNQYTILVTALSDDGYIMGIQVKKI